MNRTAKARRNRRSVLGNFFANDYPICCPGLSHGRCLTLGSLIGKALAEDTTVQAL